MNIAFIDLAQQQARIRNKIDAGLTAVLNHGAYVMGPEVGVLENRLGEWTKASHNISCSSGTDALLLALQVRTATWSGRYCAVIYICRQC